MSVGAVVPNTGYWGDLCVPFVAICYYSIQRSFRVVRVRYITLYTAVPHTMPINRKLTIISALSLVTP